MSAPVRRSASASESVRSRRDGRPSLLAAAHTVACLVAAAVLGASTTAAAVAQESDTPAGGRVLRVARVIPVPVATMWHALTTEAGILRAWGVARAKVDFRLGGTIRTSYQKDSTLDDASTIVHHVVAFEPERVLALKTDAPAGAGAHIKRICETGWSVFRLEPLGASRTRVTVAGMGYGDGPEYEQAWKHFERGNEWTLAHMEKALCGKDEPEPKAEAERTMALLRGLCGDWEHRSTKPDGSVFHVRNEWREDLPGKFLLVRGALGDASGLHPHAVFVCGVDPVRGGVAFWHYAEDGSVAHGDVQRLADDRVGFDWEMARSDGSVRRWWMEIDLLENDRYGMRLYDARDGEAAGKQPLVAVTYERQTADDPPSTVRTGGPR